MSNNVIAPKSTVINNNFSKSYEYQKPCESHKPNSVFGEYSGHRCHDYTRRDHKFPPPPPLHSGGKGIFHRIFAFFKSHKPN